MNIGAPSFLRLLVRQEPRPIVQWAEDEVKIDAKTPFRIRYAPYLREMLETPLDPTVYLTAYQVFSRGGKTTVANVLMGYFIAERPRRILMMRQTIQKAEVYSKSNFMEDFVRQTPVLRAAVPEGRKTESTIRHKMFPGGELRFFGSNAPGDLREAKGNLLIADEVDSYEASKSDEGDILKIFWKRGSEYPDTIRLAMSYPSVEGDSLIEGIMKISDARKYYIPCPRCGVEFVPMRAHIKWPQGMPEAAIFRCPHCDGAISDQDRAEAIAAGRWKPTQAFAGVAGFHASGMLWPHPVPPNCRSFYHMVAKEVEAAEKSDNPERSIRVLVNTFDSDVFRPESLPAPDSAIINSRRESYNPRQMLPKGVLWLSAGVDVQQEWLEVSLLGFGLGNHIWALEHRKIKGAIDRQSTWDTLHEYFSTCKFQHPDLGMLHLLHKVPREKSPRVFVDSGHRYEIVRKFTKPRERVGVFSVKGHPSVDAPIIQGWQRCSTTLAWVVKIGVNSAKDRIYHRLQIADPEEDGYIHFPKLAEYDDHYFGGLVGESPKLVKKGGKLFTRFEAADGLRNEPLDTFCYALGVFECARPNLKEIKAAPAGADRPKFGKSSWIQ